MMEPSAPLFIFLEKRVLPPADFCSVLEAVLVDAIAVMKVDFWWSLIGWLNQYCEQIEKVVNVDINRAVGLPRVPLGDVKDCVNRRSRK